MFSGTRGVERRAASGGRCKFQNETQLSLQGRNAGNTRVGGWRGFLALDQSTSGRERFQLPTTGFTLCSLDSRLTIERTAPVYVSMQRPSEVEVTIIYQTIA